MTFGERLKQLRKARNVTARDLAEELDMDAGYLSRIENDRFDHTPTRDTIQRIAEVLGLSAGESDELHILAGKIPADVERILLAKPKLLASVRKKEL